MLKGGHDIPQNDVIRRFNSRFDNLLNILPYCDEVHFYDNDNGFKEVGEFKNGQINIVNGNTAKWIEELSDKYKIKMKVL